MHNLFVVVKHDGQIKRVARKAKDSRDWRVRRPEGGDYG